MLDRLTGVLNDKGLRGIAFRGGAILGFGGALEHVARLIRNVILARLLAPESFGLMAIVLSFVGLLESLTEVGIRYAIIQHPRGGERLYLNVAWLFSLLRGVFLYLSAFMLAPLVANFYGTHELTLMIRVSCLSVLLNSCLSVALFARLKSMEFKRWALACNGGSILAVSATILLAFYMPTVWALVFGTVADAAMRCVLSYVVCPFVPRLQFGREELRALLQFTRGMAGLPVLYALSRSADVFVLGKVVSSSMVGTYSLSNSLARTPLDFLKGTITQVALPLLSSVQDDKAKLQSAVCHGIYLLAFVLFPAIAFVWIYGGLLLEIVYGINYSAARVPFALLFTAGAIEATAIPITNVYFAVGKPNLHRMFSFVRAAVLLATIVPGSVYFGWNGAASSVFLATLTGYLLQIYRMRSLIGIKISDIARSVLIPCLCSFVPMPVWLIGEMYSAMMARLAFAAVGLVTVYGTILYFSLALNRWPSIGVPRENQL